MSSLDRICVLVADDNRHMRSLIRAILEAVGIHDVVEARSGQHAIDILRKREVHLIICDWNMEPMTGIEFVEFIRRHDDSPDPYIPIIMLTGHTERSRVMAARDMGIDEFMVKPVTAKGLLARINAIVHNRRPFVKTDAYFGPDRRRQSLPFEGEDRRESEDPVKSQAKRPAAGNDQGDRRTGRKSAEQTSGGRG